MQLPEGASLERTTRALDDVTKRVREQPGVDKVVAIGGLDAINDSASLANAGIAYVILKDWSERGKKEDLLDLYLGLSERVKTLDDGIALVIPPPPIQGIGNVSGATMKVELRDGSFDYAQLEHLAQAIVERASSQSMFQVVRNSFRADAPQLNVDDRQGQVRDARRAARQRARCAQLLRRLHLRRAVQQVRPGVPDLRAGGGGGPPAAGVAQDPDGAQQHRRHGAARHAGRYHLGQRSLADLALQSLSRGNGRCQHRARLQLRSGPRPARADRQGDAAADCRLRMDGDVLSGEGDRQSDLSRLRAEPAARLPGAGRAVRELVRAGDRHRVGAAGAAGHGRGADCAGRAEQPLYADRPDPADRALGQERDPDRRVRARAAPARRACDRGSGGRWPPATASGRS